MIAAQLALFLRRAPTIVRAGLVVWLAAAVFLMFMAVMAGFYDYFPADLRIAHAIQDIDVPAFGGFMHFTNGIGDTKLYLLFVVGLVIAFAVLRAGWESMLVFLSAVPSAFGVVVKDWVGRPRPSALLVHVSSHESDPSFPSGHTLKTAALFGVLFFVIPAVVPWRPVRWLLQAGCLLLVAAAGPARVYVGAHWPSDVLGSYLLAFAALAPLLAAYGWLRREPRPAPAKPGAG